MASIKNIKAREILDSRGNPTVECDIYLDDNSFGRSSVPSGASTGIHEAIELRDNDSNRFFGKGVLSAVNNVNTIINNSLIGVNANQQNKIDEILIQVDGTENKNNLGANAILGTSIASAKAASNSYNMPLYKYLNNESNKDFLLPTPLANILNGGMHASNSADFQEYMIVPIGAQSFKESIQWISEIYERLYEKFNKQ